MAMKGYGSSLGAPVVSSYRWEEQFCVLNIVYHIGANAIKKEHRNPELTVFAVQR